MLRLRSWARALKRQTLVIYYAARDPRTPWFPRLLALVIAGYALSPIDLIPDFIPMLGYLDDVIIVPLGVWLVLRMIPADVIADSHAKAQAALEQPASRGMAVAIVAIWLITLCALAAWAWAAFHH